MIKHPLGHFFKDFLWPFPRSWIVTPKIARRARGSLHCARWLRPAARLRGSICWVGPCQVMGRMTASRLKVAAILEPGLGDGFGDARTDPGRFQMSLPDGHGVLPLSPCGSCCSLNTWRPSQSSQSSGKGSHLQSPKVIFFRNWQLDGAPGALSAARSCICTRS